MSQKLTWEKPGQDEERFKRYLILALLRSGVCVTLQDSRSDYLFIANLLDSWEVKPGETPTDTSIFGKDLAKRLRDLKKEVRRTGETGRLEANSGQNRYFQFIVEAIPSHDDSVDLMTTIIDLSDERQREKVLRALLREVSHRSKNLLSIIQSIATQTARHSESLERFITKFRGRLHALSHSQDLITDSSWYGVRFHQLVNQQVGRYLSDAASPLTIKGADPLLSPNASLHIGLALHELIVNAITHGSLTTAGTSITVSCTSSNRRAGRMLVFEWQEKVGQSSAGAATEFSDGITPHFGSVVLERIVPAAVDGKAKYAVTPQRVHYRLVFPAEADD